MTDTELKNARGIDRQRILFPMYHYSPYYGHGIGHDGQHRWSYAIDCIGKDGGKDEVYAPFDCTVTNVFVKSGCSPEVWLQSDKPVLASNGDIDYYTFTYTHPSEVKNMKVGQQFKQGEFVCHEGNEGVSAGNHVHVEIGKGKSKTWSIEKHGGTTYYMNQNKVKPENVWFLPETSVIDFTTDKIGSKYPIKKESEMTKYVTSKDGLYLHNAKNYNQSSEIALLDYNEPCIVFETRGSFAKVYARGLVGWCSNKYLGAQGKSIENAYVNSKNGLWLHKTKDFKVASEIDLMKYKEKVTWISTSGKFAYVDYKGTKGYCAKNYLTKI